MATVKTAFVDKESGRRYSAGMPYEGDRVRELAGKGFLEDEAGQRLDEVKPRGRRKRADS